MTRWLFLAVIGIAITASLAAAPPAYVYYPELGGACQKIANMTIGPTGVSRAQANLLADTYFRIYLGGCGGTEPAQQMKDYWRAPVVVGFGAVHDGALRIDRLTGAVSYRGHPTLHPKDFPNAFLREYSH